MGYTSCLYSRLSSIFILYTPLISFVARMNPLKFFKGIFPAQVVAFTSQSSYGTLPVTIKSLVEGVGVSENIASFVAPLGSTIGLNGCGGFIRRIVAIFATNVFNVELTIYSYILIVLTAIISSIGIAGGTWISNNVNNCNVSGLRITNRGISYGDCSRFYN